jgi:fatty acid amide hydrolase
MVARLAAARGQEHFAFLARCMGRRSANEFFELVEERNAYRTGILSAMDEASVDVLLCPPYPLPAFRHGNSEHLTTAAAQAAMFNATGMPAGVVAATVVRDDETSARAESKDRALRTAREVDEGSAGLPVGVQIVGRHWREDVVLAVMRALEAHLRAQPDYPGAPPL